MTTYQDHLLKQADSAAQTDVINPSTGEAFAKIALSDTDDVESKLTQASDIFQQRRNWLPVYQRVEILEKAATIMLARQDQLAMDIATEGGKPLMDAKVEAARAVQGVKKCIETISADQGTVIPMNLAPSSANRMAFTQKEPIGVVVAVSAFNHPLNLIVHQVGAAIAAGAPCIVKPAGDTPISCLNFCNILKEAGLPDPFLSVVLPADNSLAEKLVTDPRVGFFSFIGSARVGWMLRSKLHPGARCALEHGGVAPVIVTANADQDKALASILKGAFYHAGQVCVSTQRLFIKQSIAQDFAQKLTEGAQALVVDDARKPETQIGPLIRPNEVARVASWVDQAITEGAERLCGGDPINENFYPATVLYNPSPNSDVSQKEIFGPVVCVYPYDDLNQAITQANALPVAFQGSVFSQHLPEVMQVYSALNASAVMVNDHSAFRDDGMPFAGLKESGMGVGGIPHSIHDMQIEKMMVINNS